MGHFMEKFGGRCLHFQFLLRAAIFIDNRLGKFHLALERVLDLSGGTVLSSQFGHTVFGGVSSTVTVFLTT